MTTPDPAESGDERVICQHAERCGGCPIIALPYREQLSLKRGRVVQSTARYPLLELVYTEPVAAASPATGYRTRAKLIVGSGGRLGLFAKGGGHHVVDIPECRVLSPPLAQVATAMRSIIAADSAMAGPLSPFDASAGGALRALDLREVRDTDISRVLLTLVFQRDRAPDLPTLRAVGAKLLAALPVVSGVAANLHDGEAPQILGPETVPLAGVGSAPDRVGASLHLATFGSFVQAHRDQALRIHTALAEALGLLRKERPRVLDLYGGSGAIALSLAAAGAQVQLVESFPPAVAQAREAARAQNLSVEAHCSDVSSALRAFVDRREAFDAAILNPPRRGTSPQAREWLARLEPQVIAYVSCNPETLARDLDHLTRLGYATTSLRPFDMIPLTDEVETVAVLRRAGTPAPRVVFESEEGLIVDKAPHEPTTPQGEYMGSLLARVRRIPGAENAVPAHRLDVGTSGLVTFARTPKHVAAWERVLSSPGTRKIYLAAVRGVAPAKGAVARDLRDDGKAHPARTRYRRLAIAGGHSVLRVVPEQGRTHQIRRHLAAIGHPVLGDDRYGHATTNRYFEEKNGLDRTFLHCVRLEVDHPGQGARLVVEAPLPGDLRAVLERTSGPGTLRFLEQKSALGTGGGSHSPSASDLREDRGSAVDVDTRTSSVLHPELTSDDDEGPPSESY